MHRRAKVPRRKYYTLERRRPAAAFGIAGNLRELVLSRLPHRRRPRTIRSAASPIPIVLHARRIPRPLALNLLTRLRDARFQLAGRYMRDRAGPRVIIRADFNRLITTYPSISPHPRVVRTHVRALVLILLPQLDHEIQRVAPSASRAISRSKDTSELVIRVVRAWENRRGLRQSLSIRVYESSGCASIQLPASILVIAREIIVMIIIIEWLLKS